MLSKTEFTLTMENHLKQQFHILLFGLDLEYKDHLDVNKYLHIMKLKEVVHKDELKFKSKPLISTFQSIISEHLNLMKISHKQEIKIGPYLVDFLIEPKTIIEVDGESHFIPETQTMTWLSLIKIRQLKKLGYNVINFPYFEWQDLQYSEQKYKLFKEKIIDKLYKSVNTD